MTRPLRTNLLLLALIAGAGLLAWLTRPAAPAPDPALTALDPARVEMLRIEAGDEPPLVLRRREGHWWLTDPVELPASALEAGALLSVLETPSLRRYPATQMDLVTIGLAPPRFVLQADDLRLAFGRVEPLEGRRYVLLDETVHLIADVSPASFDANYADLASRDLDAGLGELQRIVTPSVTLTRDDRGWQATPQAASADAVQALADNWSSTAALWLLRALPEEHERSGPAFEIVGTRGRARYEILATEPQFELLRRDLDLKYVLPESAARDLQDLAPTPPPDVSD